MGALITIVILLLIINAVARFAQCWLLPGQDDRHWVESLYTRLDDFSYSEAMLKGHVRVSAILDRWFGPRHFSGRCFIVSSLTSITVVALITLCFVAVGKISLGTLPRIGRYLLVLCLLNLIVDYFSILETRIVLARANQIRGWWFLTLWGLDLLISAALFVVPFLVAHSFLPWLFQRPLFVTWQGVFPTETMARAMAFSQPIGKMYSTPWKHPQIQVCFISTLTTSFFFWTYCFWLFSLKTLKCIRPFLLSLLLRLSERKSPLLAVAIVFELILAVLTSLVYLLD